MLISPEAPISGRNCNFGRQTANHPAHSNCTKLNDYNYSDKLKIIYYSIDPDSLVSDTIYKEADSQSVLKKY